MASRRIYDLQVSASVVDLLVHNVCGSDAVSNTRNGEVIVADGCADEHRAGRQTRQQLGEVEGHPRRIIAIDLRYARHIPLVAPTCEVSSHVLWK